MARYYRVENFGVGFITHADRAAFDIRGVLADLWAIDAPNDASYGWAARVGAMEVSEADALAEIALMQAQAPQADDPIPA